MSTTAEFDLFYRSHHHALRRLARRLARTEEDAEDLLQATAERSLLKFSSYRPGTNGRGWLAKMMTRLHIDQWRRRQWTVPLVVADLEVPAREPEDEPWWLSLSAEDLRLALVELPAELRELVEAHAHGGQSYAGLADKMGIPAATVGSRLYRTRRRLRATLQRQHGRRPGRPARERLGH
jgi:RNA polymerase sigma-70 factor (ECF subfamily)